VTTRRGREWLLVLPPLLVALALAARTIDRDSCTVDEFGNLPMTVAQRGAANLHIDPGTPPLTRWIQGIGLLGRDVPLGAAEAELAAFTTSWELGYRFEEAHREDYPALLVRARWGSVAMFLLAVALVFGWARELAGARPALVAAMLAATCPNLLAHGRLVTPDIGLAAMLTAAAWMTHRAMRAGESAAGGNTTDGTAVGRPSVLPAAAAAGALAGAACLCKVSGLFALGLAAPLIFVPIGAFRPRLLRAAAFLGTAFLFLHAAYGFPGFGFFRGVPTPFPAPLIAAVQAQLAEGPYPAYLLGQLRADGGWWYYHVVAFLVKTPLPTLALVVLSGLVVLRERRWRFLLPRITAGAFLLAFGFVTSKNVGVRYLLPIFPLLFVGVTPAFLAASRSMRVAGGALAAASMVLGLAASGAPLASFNGLERLAGGKRAVLVESNLDWGQSLNELREWQEREGIETVQLAYFGRIDPSIYGVRWRTLRSEPVQGAVALSATFAVGVPYHVRMKERPFLPEAKPAWSGVDSWAWVRGLPPDEVLGGGSILVWKDMEATLEAAGRDAFGRGGR
jgi:4-amino-4-deoxy-L-arabinose transferase-like glycosyltransferase